MSLVEDDVSGFFDFTGDGVFEYDDAARGSEAKEGTCSGVGWVNFVFAHTWLFDRDMATEYP